MRLLLKSGLGSGPPQAPAERPRPLAPRRARLRTGVLAAVAWALCGCSFYVPDLTDCVLPCGEREACPQGLTCLGGLCRPPGKTAACECTAGKSRPCGSSVGVCKAGFQECTAEGVWGPCQGSVEPSPEICDGRDNDCDGVTDYLPAKLVVADRAPYTTYSTRLLGFDGGYALFHYSVRPDGGDSYYLHRYDREFTERGEPVLVRTTYTERSFVSATSSGVAMAFAGGTDEPIEVRFASMEPGTPSVRLGELQNTGYYSRIHVASRPGGARVGWITGDDLVRLADVPWGGGPPTTFDLPRYGDGGVLTDFALSSDGRFSVFQVRSGLPDGGRGFFNVLDDNESRTVVRAGVSVGVGDDYVFVRGRQPLLARGTQLAYLSDWTDAANVTRATFTYDLRTSDESLEVLPPSSWGESDVVLSPAQDLLAVFSNRKQQSLVLMSLTGTEFSNVEVVLRNLPDNSGFGPPSLALSGDEMVGVAWTTAKGVMSRRVCPPRVGD